MLTSPSVRLAAGAPLLFLLSACAGSLPSTLGSLETGLAPCPSSSNCVHTGTRHPQGTEPLLLSEAWAARSAEETATAVGAILEMLPRTLRTHTGTAGSEGGGAFYLRAESRSLVFRFADDVEVYRAPGEVELQLRSASRLGESDLGVNGRRVARLRQLLVDEGIVRPHEDVGEGTR
jgi:uncharacterized protein (DUF1499 family)